MNWSREFEDPVPGCRTLRDAANLIMALPKAEQELPHWKAAIEALILVAEMEGDECVAGKSGDVKALNVGKPGAGKGAQGLKATESSNDSFGLSNNNKGANKARAKGQKDSTNDQDILGDFFQPKLSVCFVSSV